MSSGPSPTPLIILGMHRSGTSLTAGLLQQAGLQIGQELMGANSANPKGHFENVAFYHFHQSLLRSQGVSDDGWTLQAAIPVEAAYRTQALELIASHAAPPAWGWKDPRTVLFADFWADLMPTARFLVVYRAPWEVVDSLYRRGDKVFAQQPDLAVKIWMHYNQKLLDFYYQFPKRCLLVNITTLTAAFPKLLRLLNKKFQLGLTEPAESTFYDAALLQQTASDSHQPSQIAHYFPKAVKLYEALEATAWFPKEIQPSLSWQKQTTAKFHRLAAFENWQHLRGTEQYSQILTRQLEQAINQEQALQTQLQTVNADLEFAHATVEEIRLQVQQRDVEQEQLKAILQKKEAAWLTTEQQLQHLQTTLQEKETALVATEQQLLQTQTVLQEKDAALTEIEQHALQVQVTLQEQAAALLATKQQLEDTEATLQTAEAERKETIQRYEQVQTTLQEKETTLLVAEQQLQRTQTEWADLQLQHQSAQVHLAQLQEEFQQQTNRLTDCQTDLTTYQTSNQQLQARLTETQSQLSASEAQRQQLVTELDQAHQQVQQTQTDFQTRQTELQRTQTLLDDTVDVLHQTQTHLHEADQALQQTHAQLQQTIEARQHAEAKQQELETLVTQFRIQQQQDQAEQTILKARLQQATATINQLQTEVEQTQTHSQQTQTQLHQTEAAAAQQQVQHQELQRVLKQTRQELVQSRWQAARWQFQSTLSPVLSQPELQYQLAVWDAWYALHQGNQQKMIASLRDSAQYTTTSRSALVLQWLQMFTQWSQSQDNQFDIHSLIDSSEWQSLVKQLCTQKRRVPVQSS
jgi:hypothetical protein